MNVGSIRGIPPTHIFSKLRKRSVSTDQNRQQDDINISSGAKHRKSIQDFIQRIKKHIDNLPEYRIDRVRTLQGEVGRRYAFDGEKVSQIADRLLKQFNI